MLGIFVDTTNLYRTVHKKFKDKLCYDLYREKVEALFGVSDYNAAYVMQISTEAGSFIGCLRAAGFGVRTKQPLVIKTNDREIKRCNWHVEMCVDIFQGINDKDALTTVVLGSSDSELLPLVKFLESQGVKVIILASLIPRRLAEAASKAIEITEDLLEQQDDSE